MIRPLYSFGAFLIVSVSAISQPLDIGNRWELFVDRYLIDSMRLDGFASVSAPYEKGEMITKSILVTGKQLVLNNATSANGSIQVELQTVEGESIPGFTLHECKLLEGDSIDRVVEWETTAGLSALAGQAV